MVHNVYDLDGRQASVTDPDGNVTTSHYDALGHLVGGPEYHGYYFDGSLADVAVYGSVLSAGRVAAHHRAGVDAAETTTYAYDGAGRVVSSTDPDGRMTSFGYDAEGSLVSSTDAAGRVSSSSFDVDGRLVSAVYPATSGVPGFVVGYSYDGAGRRLSMSDASGVTSYAYDGSGRLSSVTDGAGLSVGYGYDGLGRVDALTYPDGLVVSRPASGPPPPPQPTPPRCASRNSPPRGAFDIRPSSACGPAPGPSSSRSLTTTSRSAASFARRTRSSL